MTLTFNIVFSNYIICVKIWISVINLSLVNGFISYSHTMLLRSRYFHLHVALWPWPSDDFYIQHCSSTICVQKFFSYKLFISWQIYFILTHNVALFLYADMSYCDLHLCWKIRRKNIKTRFNASAFPCYWCQICIVQANGDIGHKYAMVYKIFFFRINFFYMS